MKTRLLFLCWTFAVAVGAQEPARDPVVLAVQRVLPAVVNINTERVAQRQYRDPFDDIWRQFFGQARQPDGGGGQSLGSGVVVDEDGWIITNWHVVRRATKIHAVLSDGTKYEARCVSGDEKNDLALLKIDAPKPLPAVRMTSETEPLLGETVIAVGNPFGLEQTVTRGIISAKNRRYTADDNTTFEDILQTDASINPGNSGGPLINTRGELVGINMAILSQAQGIGFAIPARRVSALLATWFSPEKRAGLWLGLRFDRQEGQIVITDVRPNSPAAKAGLRAGTVLGEVDGQRFTDVLSLQRHVIHKKAGDEVKFQVGDHSVVVKLAALPKLSAPDLMWTKFGLRIQPMTTELAEAMGLTISQGLLVADVQPESPAAAQGVRRGMVVTHVAGEEFQSLDRLAEQLADVKTSDAVSMAVFISERRGNFVLQQTTSVTVKSR